MEAENNMDNSESQSDDTRAIIRRERLMELLEQATLDDEVTETNDEAALQNIRKTVDEMDELLDEVNPNDNVTGAAQLLIDARLLKLKSEKLAKVFKKHADFDVDEFAHRILESGYEELFKTIYTMPLTIYAQPVIAINLNDEVTHEPPKERKRNQQSQIENVKKPENLKQVVRDDKGAKMVRQIQTEILKIFNNNNNTPVPYFKIIIDPNSFMQTVDNALQLSFLYGRRFLSIEFKDDQHHSVRLTTTQERKEGIQSRQKVVNLTMNIWQEMIEYYRITEPLLKIEPQVDSDDESIENNQEMETLSDSD